MAKDMVMLGLAINRLGKRERKSWSGNAGRLRRGIGRVAGMRIPAG
jgi:hypothetical protein